jgi:polysaccharide deacetylase 2 family uncharacterized protein YibQ
MADELSAPLGRRKARMARLAGAGPRRFAIGNLPLARLGIGVVVLVLLGVGLRILFVNDPQGGRPSATVAINSTRANNPVAGQVATPAPPPPAATFATALPQGASIITVDPSLPSGAAVATPGGMALDANGMVPALSEDTKNGPIPRMDAKGNSPFMAYARPVPANVMDAGKPMVAIIVTGLGLNEAGTLDAAEKLPPEVDMAFAPYGKTLPHTVGAARAAGHELLLEAPLEPFDYPDTDPGPQTLLTGQPVRDNLAKLYWLMARFGGYVGLINHTGARFTASSADFSPVMEELGTRGLGYLDDGTSNRSVAMQLAQANKVPFGRADAVLDANPARAPILAALEALVATASSKGSAVGVISALPVSIATVAEWAQTLPDSNVVLVPASALMK